MPLAGGKETAQLNVVKIINESTLVLCLHFFISKEIPECFYAKQALSNLHISWNGLLC